MVLQQILDEVRIAFAQALEPRIDLGLDFFLPVTAAATPPRAKYGAAAVNMPRPDPHTSRRLRAYDTSRNQSLEEPLLGHQVPVLGHSFSTLLWSLILRHKRTRIRPNRT